MKWIRHNDIAVNMERVMYIDKIETNYKCSICFNFAEEDHIILGFASEKERDLFFDEIIAAKD